MRISRPPRACIPGVLLSPLLGRDDRFVGCACFVPFFPPWNSSPPTDPSRWTGCVSEAASVFFVFRFGIVEAVDPFFSGCYHIALVDGNFRFTSCFRGGMRAAIAFRRVKSRRYMAGSMRVADLSWPFEFRGIVVFPLNRRTAPTLRPSPRVSNFFSSSTRGLFVSCVNPPFLFPLVCGEMLSVQNRPYLFCAF